jgi:myo-inositol 2-dehydrogenase/D-chiro-inositol 1-dehydrogenase
MSAAEHSDTSTGRPVRIGLIGAGRIGRLHAELLARSVPGARLGPIFDVDTDAARAAAAKFGVPHTETVDDLLAADLDAVAICSSTDSHAELLVAAAQANKAIFCEKPVALDLATVDHALAAVRDAGVTFQIGFNRRFDPAHASVRQAVANGSVGELHLLRISSRDPEPPPLSYVQVSGGIFLDMTIHDFDMARFVTGSEVTQVYALGAVRIEPAFAQAGDVDTAVVNLLHENGCITTIDNSRKAVYGFDQRVEAFGSAGVAASENPLVHTGVVRTSQGGSAPRLPHFFLDRYMTSYLQQWEYFVDLVRSGEPSDSQLADARAPLAIGLAAWRSVREQRPVAVDAVAPQRPLAAEHA